jgi:hypothetical protein
MHQSKQVVHPLFSDIWLRFEKMIKIEPFSFDSSLLQHKVLIDPANLDLVHHLLVYECDPASRFDDANLPDDLCDNIYDQLELCTSNIASIWAVGGDHVCLFKANKNNTTERV